MQKLLLGFDQEVATCRATIQGKTNHSLPLPEGIPPLQSAPMTETRRAILESMIDDRCASQLTDIDSRTALSEKIRNALKAHVSAGWTTLKTELLPAVKK